MSSIGEPWGKWADAMRAASIGNPRNGRPSWTQLAQRAGVSTSTVTNAVTGRTAADPSTVQAIAAALRMRPEEISGWLEVPTVSGPYEPPAEGSLLLPHERDAIDQLIRAIARGREEVSNGAATKSAGRAPAGVIEPEVEIVASARDREAPDRPPRSTQQRRRQDG